MLISKEKRDLIEDYIHYDLLIRCCRKDKQFLQENNDKIYAINERLLVKVIARAENHLKEIQPKLAGTKIEKWTVTEKFVTYNFQVMGHQEQHTYYKMHMRNRIQKILEEICRLDA